MKKDGICLRFNDMHPLAEVVEKVQSVFECVEESSNICFSRSRLLDYSVVMVLTQPRTSLPKFLRNREYPVAVSGIMSSNAFASALLNVQVHKRLDAGSMATGGEMMD